MTNRHTELDDTGLHDHYQIDAHILDNDAHHDRYTNAEAVAAILAADGPGSGLDADLLDGQHANAFAPATPTAIPEVTLSFTHTVDFAIGKKYFYLPRDHHYLAAQTPRHITSVIVDSLDRTGDYGTVWEEVIRKYPIKPGTWPGYTLPYISTLGDDSITALTWCVERKNATNAETWDVTWIEKRITFNPIQARGCVFIGNTTTPDTSVDWISQKRYLAGQGLQKNRNTNGFILSGIPAGYKALLWICQVQSRTHLYRGKHWRPAMIKAPAAGDDYIALNAKNFKTNRLVGVSLFNPATGGAYSPVTVVGYVSKGSHAFHNVRVLK